MANIIAIVGRTNVGKSTLFNRLVEQRKAIMNDTQNTTRDRHYGKGQWTDKHFTVIDTGGYIEGTAYVFEKAIREQIIMALHEASVILFMVDCKDGPTGLDQDFANILRTINKPLLLVANKVDNTTTTLMAPSFHALGMGEPYPISAASGGGTGELLDALLPYLQHEQVEEQKSVPKFTIVGRPNVGKSSFLNVLIGAQRSIVTDIAGTTRDPIDTHYKLYNKEFIVVDTAGLRRKARVKEDVEFYAVLRAVRALQDADICLIMIDATHGLEAQDSNIISLAHRYKKGMVILVNKWDLVDKETNTAATYKKKLLAKLSPLDYIPVIFTSTVKKQRIYQTIEKALVVYENKRQKLATSILNKVMLEIITKVHPPSVKGKHIKIKYMTQLTGQAPTFALFCNHPQYIQPNYKRYLENQLRTHFDFEGVPIQLVFKQK